MWFKRKQPAANNQHVTLSDKLVKDAGLNSEFILGAIEDGVVMVGTDKIIHLFNPAASHITGWPADEAVGLDYQSVLSLVDAHGVAYPPEAHPFAKALQTGTTVRDSKGYLSSRNGKYIPVSLIVSPVTEVAGQSPTRVVGVFRDITIEKMEENRRSEFVSTASHEMRTPIAAIEGYLALALNPKVATIDAHAKTYLEKAHLATQHLGELFADLLTSSKAEDGRLASYPTVVEIGEIIEQIVDDARFNAQKKGLELRYVISSDSGVTGGKVIRPLYYVYLDPNRMREVAQNLLDNAIKYTTSGTVTLALTGNQSIVQIQVRDTGAGIPQEDIPHLFQKFYRVDNTMTRNIGGTGLGLFICKRLVEMYNGRIWIESQLGKGSTFFINLPRLSTEQALEKQRTHIISPIKPL